MTRRLALVGCGRIGSPVVAAWEAGELPGWDLVGVLVRSAEAARGPLFTTDLSTLLARNPELVVEVAGPPALAAVAETVLRACDLWTVSGVALADDELLRRLETAGRDTGHRLRILPGAFAGLDGVATAAAAPNASLHLDIDLMPGPAPAELRFSGSVRQAALQFPNSVNIAVAAALAGPGLDATRIDVRHPGPVERNRLALRAESAAGTFEASVQPRLSHGVHPVACNVIAALRREMQTVWVG